MATTTEREKWLNKTIDKINNKQIVILQGLRRTGKTTIQSTIYNEFVNKTNLNIKRHSFNIFGANDDNYLLDLIEEFKESPNTKYLLLFDEFQDYSDWNRFFKTIYDEYKNVNIFATGSVSHNTTETNNTEGGRYSIITLPTLSFNEYIKLYNKIDIESEFINYFYEYATMGSYPPQDWTNSIKEYKEQISINIIEKIKSSNILERFNISKSSNIDSVLRYIIEYLGSTMSPTLISKKISINKVTIDKIIEYLKNNHIIHQIDNISKGLGKAAGLNKKYYLNDHTFYLFVFEENFKTILKNRDDNLSSFIVENLFLNEIKRRFDRYEAMAYFYIKNKTDIDFIIKKGSIKYYFEIKTSDKTNILSNEQKKFSKDNNLNIIYFGKNIKKGKLNYINVITFLKGEETWI